MAFIDPDESGFVDPDEQKQQDWTTEYPTAYSVAKGARELLGPTVEMLGTAAGGALGLPLGPVGTVGGAGLGYGISKEVLDLADQLLKTKQAKPLPEKMQEAAGNVLEGAAMEAAVPAIKGVFAPIVNKAQQKFGQYSFDKAKKVFEEALGSDLDVARQALQNAPSTSTSGQAISEAGVRSPTFQALYESVKGTDPATAKFFFDQQRAKEAARLANLRGVTPNLEEAIAARSEAATPLYEQAAQAQLPGRTRLFGPATVGRSKAAQELDALGLPKQVEVGRESITNQPIMEQAISRGGVPQRTLMPVGFEYNESLKPLLDRPVIKSAFDTAEKNAQNKGKSLFDAQGNLTGEGAHTVKLALDDAISGTATSSIARNEREAMMGARDAYLNWLEKENPVYQQARKVYAEKSAPVNQAKVLNELTNVLQNPATEGERLTPFMNALTRGETSLLKRANQEPRFGGISDILTPQQMAAVNRASTEMVSEKSMEQLGKSQEGKKALAALLDETLPKWHLPQMLSRTATVLNRGLGELERRVGKQTMDLITEGMKSGKSLDDILSGVHPFEQNRVKNLFRYPDTWLGKRAAIPAGISSVLQGPPEKQYQPPRTLAEMMVEKENAKR